MSLWIFESEVACFGRIQDMDKLLGIHEDGEAEEDVAGGGGGKAADVGGDEQGGGDRHQAGGHQLDGRVFPSWVVRYQTIGYNEVFFIFFVCYRPL